MGRDRGHGAPGRVRSRRGARLLPHLVRAEQRGPGGRRRLRRAPRHGARAPLLRAHPARQGSRPSVVPAGGAGLPPPHRGPGGGASRAPLLRLVHGPVLPRGRTGPRHAVRDPLRRAELAPLSAHGLRGPDGVRRQRLPLFARVRRPHRGGGDGPAAGAPVPAARPDGRGARPDGGRGADRRGVAAGQGGDPGRLPGRARASRDEGRPARALRDLRGGPREADGALGPLPGSDPGRPAAGGAEVPPRAPRRTALRRPRSRRRAAGRPGSRRPRRLAGARRLTGAGGSAARPRTGPVPDAAARPAGTLRSPAARDPRTRERRGAVRAAAPRPPQDRRHDHDAGRQAGGTARTGGTREPHRRDAEPGNEDPERPRVRGRGRPDRRRHRGAGRHGVPLRLLREPLRAPPCHPRTDGRPPPEPGVPGRGARTDRADPARRAEGVPRRADLGAAPDRPPDGVLRPAPLRLARGRGNAAGHFDGPARGLPPGAFPARRLPDDPLRRSGSRPGRGGHGGVLRRLGSGPPGRAPAAGRSPGSGDRGAAPPDRARRAPRRSSPGGSRDRRATPTTASPCASRSRSWAAGSPAGST